MNSPLSQIPQVEVILKSDALAPYIAYLGRPIVSNIISDVFDDIRKASQAESAIPNKDEITTLLVTACKKVASTRIHRVINGTGIVLHTNLGRSPLPLEIWKRCTEHAEGYAAIEMDIATGKRGSRFPFLIKSICTLTGAEDAVIVNNNAAAVFLLLCALAHKKEVIVSRGQQIQIGGGFRIPDILQQAGCELKAVGTTNITTIEDIQSAITENTAMVLWVHTSNYKIRGFTKAPHLSEIKKILPNSVLLAIDQGSGNLMYNIPEELRISTLLKQGADILCFSGDKILGGPQAGFIVGNKDTLSKIKKHPLMRTYRIGKTIAALMEEVLVYYMNGGTGPIGETLALSHHTLTQRGKRLLKLIPKDKAMLVSYPFSLGGGSTPDQAFDSLAVKIICPNPIAVQNKLREQTTPIFSFIDNDALLLHLATIHPEDFSYIGKILTEILQG